MLTRIVLMHFVYFKYSVFPFHGSYDTSSNDTVKNFHCIYPVCRMVTSSSTTKTIFTQLNYSVAQLLTKIRGLPKRAPVALQGSRNLKMTVLFTITVGIMFAAWAI